MHNLSSMKRHVEFSNFLMSEEMKELDVRKNFLKAKVAKMVAAKRKFSE